MNSFGAMKESRSICSFRYLGVKELNMSFKSVWGFDPDEASNAQRMFRGELETDDLAYNAEEERAARIPSDMYAQVYELRRMYRL